MGKTLLMLISVQKGESVLSPKAANKTAFIASPHYKWSN